MVRNAGWRAFVIVVLVLGLVVVPGTQVQADSSSGRYFSQTGFSVDNDVIWNYFNRRGGINTFGYPVSRPFLFEGFTVQFFQRRIVQIGANGPGLLNVLDPGLMPYNSFNGAIMPPFDSSLVGTAPPPTDPNATLAWVQADAPNVFQGLPVIFYQTFANSVSDATAFPNGGDPGLLPGFDLEMWGIPTSEPAFDPNNHNVVYQRFQRGIMQFNPACSCTQGVLLVDYFKDILTGENLPADLSQEAQDSPFYQQYDPAMPNAVRQPLLLPNTDLTDAFAPETSGNCALQPNAVLVQFLAANPTVATRLGCPETAVSPLQLAAETFQGGTFLWRADNNTIYALPSQGSWSSYLDTYTTGEPLPSLLPPPGLFAPQRGFGKLWQQESPLRQTFGWATEVEHGMTGGSQAFTNAVVVWTVFDNWIGAPSHDVYIVFPDGTWAGLTYSGTTQ